ncbi:MAG TPA: hypothetical protein VMV91_09425 [Rhodocyclaceae bacterium]|nr:hypothetical protein [Rhodocyclaceae bacterium]HUX24246.1 hypothetical protein [Burkholderiales bacterium]
MTTKYKTTLHTLALPTDVIAAMAAAEAALGAGPKIADAITRNIKDIETARAEFEVAADVLAKAEATMALADDEPAAKKLEREAIKFGEVAEEKRQRVGRLERIGKALKAKALESDLDVSQARDALRDAANNLTTDLVQTISAEIAEAAKPLLAVLLRAHALNNTLPDRELGRALGDVMIPNPASWQHPFLQTYRMFVDGKVEDQLQTWRNDPAAKALHDALLPVKNAMLQLSKHAERPIPPATDHGYEIRTGPALPVQQPNAMRAQRALEGNSAAGVAGADFANMPMAEALGVVDHQVTTGAQWSPDPAGVHASSRSAARGTNHNGNLLPGEASDGRDFSRKSLIDEANELTERGRV